MKTFFVMAFVLVCDITVGQYRFRQVNEVRIEKSWRELGDKCELRLSSLKNRMQEAIHPGDAVSVKLWYDGFAAREEFNGFVRRISPNFPFELECDDHIYFFKKTPINKTWTSTTLKEVVKYLVSEVNRLHSSAAITLSSKLPDVDLKPFLIESGNTAATALQKLREEFGLASYLKGRELFTGLAYEQSFGNVKYNFAHNIIGNDLTFREESESVIQIKPIGYLQNGQKITLDKVVGDKDGELKTWIFYTANDKAQLKKLAEEKLKEFKFTGFEGAIDTFLYPYAEPLMTAELFDPQYGTRVGKYNIDSVKTQFGAYGARRTVELGIKLSI